MTQLSADSQVFGPFRLLEKLGQGGMGTVYKALDTEKNRVVALKVASRMVANEPTLAQRFHHEFAVAGQLHHPHLVRALGYGVENDLPYLVLEYIPGHSLSQHLKKIGPVPLPEALAAFAQIAEAVGFIHAHNLIHRDIKPANILMDLRGKAKLADLGLMKDLNASVLLTQSQMGLGTLEYGAPEQFDDAKHVDLRCDIYALAVALYVAVTGKLPFGPGTEMQVLMRKMDYQFTPLSQMLPDVSGALDATINRSMHPDPAVRPASAAEFITGILSQEPTASVSVRPGVVPAAALRPQDRRTTTRHSVRLPVRIESRTTGLQDSWQGHLVDLSAGGLCLHSSWRMEPHSELLSFFPGDGAEASYPLHTRWAMPLPDKTWLIGCGFDVPLDQTALDRLILADTSKTEFLER